MIMNTIFLYGPPGSGKSCVGRILAQNLNLDFLDLDQEIEKFAGMSIPQVMEQRSEIGFRDFEFSALQRAVQGRQKVIALGGGALLRDSSRTLAETTGSVVILTADLPTLLSRLRADEKVRPLLAGDMENRLAALLDARSDHYRSFKTPVSSVGKTPERIADEIHHLLGRFYVLGMGVGYDVIFQQGGFDGLPEYFKVNGFGGPLAIVCDENVASLYGDSLCSLFSRAGTEFSHPHLITIPPGEEHKNLGSVVLFWRRFLEAGLSRKSSVLSVGGGVIGDLVGFAASTYMRGIAWVNIPTSLLSMVDASIGGKTGFNLPEGKNLVGSFHPPRLVLANPNMLRTLPDIEFRSGLAEVVKHGIIADPELLDLCARGYDFVRNDPLELVRRAIAVKVHVILEDPYEQGLRTVLNLGHTVAHAVETVSEYRIRHGEAVSLGLVAEAKLAERLGLAKKGLAGRIGAVLAGLGLPIKIPAGLNRSSLIASMRLDKKRAHGVVNFPLPVDIGDVKWGVPVSDLEMIFEE
jgi:shikimate kinase/3-dehydroquinate synthase